MTKEDMHRKEHAAPARWFKLPRLWRRQPRGAPLAARFSGLASAATTLIEETEPDFLRLGRNLKDLYECAAEVGRSTEEQVASLRNAVSETRLTGTDGLAAILLDELHRGLAESEVELSSLGEICAALLRLIDLGGKIGTTAMFLRTARYSFRVESARTDATRQSFGTFTEELEPLALRIGTVGEAISVRSTSAHAELAELVRTVRAGSQQLRGLAADSGRVIEQACLRGQQLLDSAFTVLQESGAGSRQIALHADAAIYHVQFGDIVRQKIEHISTAFTEAAAIAASPAQSSRADTVLAIQHGQIELIQSEIAAVQRGLQEAFAGLGHETARLASALRTLGGSESGSRDAIFDELKTRLRQLDDLESRGGNMRERSRASWDHAVETSREVSGYMDQVREINFQMHLQSLNAIIKTEWLGADGHTLGVLSSHMHTLFRESSSLVADTAEVLDLISKQTGGSRGPVDRLDLDSEAGIETRLAAISRVQEEFSRTVASAEAMETRQSLQLEQSHRTLGFLDDLSTRLEALAADIRSVRQEIAPLVNRGDTARDLPAVAQHSTANHYTMESEREIHRRLVSGTASEPAAANQGGDMGDNIELF